MSDNVPDPPDTCLHNDSNTRNDLSTSNSDDLPFRSNNAPLPFSGPFDPIPESDVGMETSTTNSTLPECPGLATDSDLEMGSSSGSSNNGFDHSKPEDVTMVGDDNLDYSQFEDFTATVAEDANSMMVGTGHEVLEEPDEFDDSESDEYDMEAEEADLKDTTSRTNKVAHKSAISQNVDNSTFFLLDDEPQADIATVDFPEKPGLRKVRVSGGLLAYAKKVSGLLDSDDELIVSMKEQGYSDAQIADHLARDGRIIYSRKTINTRFARIRAAQGHESDEMLMRGYIEWRLEDDQLLMKAKDMADQESQDKLAIARGKRFDKVADHMYRMNPEMLFSAKACKERYIGLMNGTAKIPSDQADDPQKHRKEVLTFQEARKKIHQAKQKQAEAKKAAADKALEATMAHKAEKFAKAAAKRQKAAEYKTSRELEKQEKQLQHINDKEAARQRREVVAIAKKLIKTAPPAPTAPLMSIKTLTTISPANVPDPRLSLTLDELKGICLSRSISQEGRTTSELVERLKAADMKLTLTELKHQSRLRGLNASANKPNLILQLAEHEAKLLKSKRAVEAQTGSDSAATDV